MTETGWPLIPRDSLPAPLPAAQRPRAATPPLPPPADPGRQLSIFGAETTESSPADLAGLLAGPAHLGRMGGTARVSIPVDAAWRVHVLIAELTARGLETSWQPLNTPEVRAEQSPPVPEATAAGRDLVTVPDPAYDPDLPALDPDDDWAGASGPDDHGRARAAAPDDDRIPAKAASGAAPAGDEPGEPVDDRLEAATGDGTDPTESGPPRPRFEVRTAYSKRLNGLARAWPEAAAQLFLSGPRLRLWVAAAGSPVRHGYALGLDPAKDTSAVDAALVRAGLAGRVSDDGRHYLISGRRRLARLAELVGDRPPAAPHDLWPGGAGA
jgi:hypothetical protein